MGWRRWEEGPSDALRHSLKMGGLKPCFSPRKDSKSCVDVTGSQGHRRPRAAGHSLRRGPGSGAPPVLGEHQARAVPCAHLTWPKARLGGRAGGPGNDPVWQGRGLRWLRLGYSVPVPADSLGWDESLPEFRTPLVVDVFHLPQFLQRASGELGVRGRNSRGRQRWGLSWTPRTSAAAGPSFLRESRTPRHGGCVPSHWPVASPTWEISARMIPRYCLPCPRASMSARNSLLS